MSAATIGPEGMAALMRAGGRGAMDLISVAGHGDRGLFALAKIAARLVELENDHEARVLAMNVQAKEITRLRAGLDPLASGMLNPWRPCEHARKLLAGES